MDRRSQLRLAPLLLVLAAVAGCPASDRPGSDGAPSAARSADRDPRPSIVMIVVCSLRRSELGFAGYPRDTSPFIDSLVARGTSFERAVGAASWTKPSTASLLTGLTPNVHRMTDFYDAKDIVGYGFSPRRTLADEIVTLPELLAGAGYATMGRNNNIHAGHYFNLDQGFQDSKSIDSGTHTPDMLRDFARWVARLDPGQPFFFFMLTRDAHVAYKPEYAYYRRFARAPVPEDAYLDWVRARKPRVNAFERSGTPIPEADKRDWIDLYDAELRQLDDALSELPGILERAGRASNTVIVLTADHGERLFDPHGSTSHGGGFLEEHLIHIPLVFQGAGIPAGVKIDDVVRSIDVYPTLAALAGARPPGVVQGRSLLPRIRGEPMPPVSAFASYDGAFHVVRMGDDKLHLAEPAEFSLYDVASDPEETSPRVDVAPEKVARLRRELQRWLDDEAALRRRVAQGDTKALSPDAIEQLRELGYIE